MWQAPLITGEIVWKCMYSPLLSKEDRYHVGNQKVLMDNEEYKILFEKLSRKVKLVRALQKRRDAMKNWFPRPDREKLYRLQRELDNIIILDEEGIKKFIHNPS